jgi:hypothetical protein
MKIQRTTIVFLTLCAAVPAARVEPGLPVWNEGELAGLEEQGWVAGGLLLGDDPVPDDSERPPEQALDVAQPTPEEIAETEDPGNEIPEEFWPEYFDARPGGFLVDPQGLLSLVDYKNRLGFLNYHAGDSSIDLFVYLFKGEQEIPGEVREEELVERFFSEGRPAAVIYYYMGAPQRSVLYLSPSLTDAVSVSEQRRAVESSVMQAFKDVDPARQIEGFLVQMSIRIYWMERMLFGDAKEGRDEPDYSRPVRVEERKPTSMEKLQPLIEMANPYIVPAGTAGGILLAGLIMSAWMKRRARYHFPEFEVEPRLGGSHAAGVGAVISFARGLHSSEAAAARLNACSRPTISEDGRRLSKLALSFLSCSSE